MIWKMAKHAKIALEATGTVVKGGQVKQVNIERRGLIYLVVRSIASKCINFPGSYMSYQSRATASKMGVAVVSPQ